MPVTECVLLSVLFRILSDWLESKFGGGKGSDSSEEQVDGVLKTLCVTNTVQQKGQQIHRVHISIKVRADCSLYVRLVIHRQIRKINTVLCVKLDHQKLANIDSY